MIEKHSNGADAMQQLGLSAEYHPAPKKRRWLRNTFIFFLVLLLVIAGASVAYLWNLNRSIAEVETIPDPFPAAETRIEDVQGPRNMLLIGSDTRGEISDDIDEISGQRSDAIMVVHIPESSDSMQVMSIMRDNWVELPNGQQAKINAALAYGGVSMLVETVEGLIQDQIDHVAIIDFEGFTGLTNALGGVTLNNPTEFSDRGTVFPEGTITLQGEDALKFVRARYPFADGDYTRVKNQQLFIKSVMSKMLSSDTLTNPIKVQEVVASITPYLTTDDGITGSYLLSEAVSMRSVRPGDIRFFTSPTLGTGTSPDGQSIVLPDWEAWDVLAEHFTTDSVDEWNPEAGQ